MKEKSKALAPIEDLRNSLTKMAPEFKKALPSHISVDKFTRVLMTSLQTNADLVSTNRNSFFAACVKCAQDGLLPDGREAAFVVFRSKAGPMAVYMPMVNGILKKVRNSGELLSLNPGVVYSNDEFRYWIDETGPHMKHAPSLDGERGKLTHVYCSAQIKGGGIYLEVMSKEEIEKVRSVSKSKDSGPWVQWYEEMAKKTVVRRLSKRLPVSTDLQTTIESDDQFYQVKEVEEIKQPKLKSSRLAKLIEDEDEEPEVKTIHRKGKKGFESETEEPAIPKSEDDQQEFNEDFDKDTDFKI